MASMSKIQIIGNATKDAEFKDANGTFIASVSIATNKKIKGEDRASFWNITFFGKLAEVARDYVKKGMPIWIDGEPTMESYTDKNGIDRVALKIVASQLQLLGRREESAPIQRKVEKVSDLTDDVPF